MDQKGQAQGRTRALFAFVGRRERYFWLAALAAVAVMQWPMLKGVYYRVTGAREPAGRIEWRTDLDVALAEARSTHRQVLADFSAEWCAPCLAMKHDVWPAAEVGQAVNASFVPLAVDVDRNGPVAERYGVNGIPAVMILDAEGHVVRQASGYLPASGVLQFLAKAR
jgi:thiol:disulfide interchange protein